jgi:hypothetical protein
MRGPAVCRGSAEDETQSGPRTKTDRLDARRLANALRRDSVVRIYIPPPVLSSVKSETANRFASCGEAKIELFDYIEVFYNQRRRHSTLGQISPAEFERRKNEEGVDPMENRTERGFPQAPHPSSLH